MRQSNDTHLTKAEKSWILYDVANSAFIMIVTATIPIYFRSLAEGAGVSSTAASSLGQRHEHFHPDPCGALAHPRRDCRL